MKIIFYGTRGSVPVPDRNFSEFGGNTPCLLVGFENGRIAIFDAGTGLRKLGNDLLDQSIEQYDNIFIGLTHTHWDHIQGFPYFKPAYDTRRRFTIARCGKGRVASSNLAGAFEIQMQQDFFPVPFNRMGAELTFWEPEILSFTAPSGVHIFTAQHNHPGGGAFGYRITEGAKTLVYCTDVEYLDGIIDPKVVELARDADLLIHDAQFTTEELIQKKGWGHSTWEQAVEVAEVAGVKQLALFHHDPDHDDVFLLGLERQCRKRFSNSFFAREGVEISI